MGLLQSQPNLTPCLASSYLHCISISLSLSTHLYVYKYIVQCIIDIIHRNSYIAYLYITSKVGKTPSLAIAIHGYYYILTFLFYRLPLETRFLTTIIHHYNYTPTFSNVCFILQPPISLLSLCHPKVFGVPAGLCWWRCLAR